MADYRNRHKLKELQLLGGSTLLADVLFFLALLVCILLAPTAGFLPAVVLAGVFFVAFIFYLNRKNAPEQKKAETAFFCAKIQ